MVEGRARATPANVLEAVARNTATGARMTPLAADAAHGGSPVSEQTLGVYLCALGRLMVAEPQPAWSPVLRSKARVRTLANLTSSIPRWRRACPMPGPTSFGAI